MTDNQLHRCAPETQGVPSAAILAFVEAADKNVNDIHSLMLLRHGNVIAEGWWSPYTPDRPHMLWSLSKSFTSTAVGLAIAEGRLSIYDRVVDFFPADLPAVVSENLAAMRVKDLLAMATGHQEDTTDAVIRSEDGNWVKTFLSLPVPHKPGTHFLYNTGATYMLSAIVHKLTGMPLVDYLTPRLFEPLGIEKPYWETDPRGINTGGFGLNLKTEDIARFGQLYLQNGVWQGKQIVPAGWIAQATTRQTSNGSSPDSDWEQGYGFQFWRCRPNAYRGDGAFGQYCIVMPEQDAVLAMTCGTDEMQSVLDLVWKHLLPAFGPDALPANSTVQSTLERRLNSLALIPPRGTLRSPLEETISGKAFAFAPNPLTAAGAVLEFTGEGFRLALRDVTGEHAITGGRGVWQEGQTTLFVAVPNPLIAPKPLPYAASGVWTAEDTFQVTLRFPTTPFHYTISCRFNGDQVTIDACVHHQFGPAEYPRLVGKIK